MDLSTAVRGKMPGIEPLFKCVQHSSSMHIALDLDEDRSEARELVSDLCFESLACLPSMGWITRLLPGG